MIPLCLALALAGCGTLSGGMDPDSMLRAGVSPPLTASSLTPPLVVAEPRRPSPAVATRSPTSDTDDHASTAHDGTPGISDRSPAFAAEDALHLSSAPRISDGPPTLHTERALRLTEDDDTRSWPAAQAREAGTSEGLEDEYDPWESFNEKMFTFNRNLDRFVLKPAARVYRVIMPEPFQLLIENGFDNIRFVPRLINSLLQGKWGGAGRELSRFLINSTAGIGGLFDPAKNYWGIEKSREDFGQTLGVWGHGPGPFLILPLLPPLTVRDGIGFGVDSFLDPLSYVLPFFWDRLGMKLGDTLNDRAVNFDLFQGFEESVIDMYSAVRHGYLRRREQLIKE